MLASNIPSKSAKVFGVSATGTYIRTVPQTTGDPAAASFDLGFPPQTFTDEGAGGTPPDGRDFNGILNHLSGWARWFMAGGTVPYDSAFQTSIGGYPAGARVSSLTTVGLTFLNLVDNNTTNPEGVGAANWLPMGRGSNSGSSRWEYLPNGDLHQYGNIPYTASGTPNITGTFSFPKPFATAGLRIIGTVSQQPNPSWSAATCILSFIDASTARYAISSGNASQNFTQSGQISWDAIGT